MTQSLEPVPSPTSEALAAFRVIVREELARVERPILDRLLTATEAADYLGISVNALRTKTSRGTLPCAHLGRSVRYRISDLDGALT